MSESLPRPKPTVILPPHSVVNVSAIARKPTFLWLERPDEAFGGRKSRDVIARSKFYLKSGVVH